MSVVSAYGNSYTAVSGAPLLLLFMLMFVLVLVLMLVFAFVLMLFEELRRCLKLNTSRWFCLFSNIADINTSLI